MGRVFFAFFVSLGITLLATTSAVIAADETPAKAGPYIVGGVGAVDYNITTSDLQALNRELVALGFSSSSSSTDNSGLFLKGHGGYHINKYLALEGGFTSLGQLEVNTTLTGPSETLTTTADLYGIEVSGLVKLETESSFGYLRLGFLAWDADISVNTSLGTATAFDSGTDPTIGIGWHFGKTHGLRVEYQYYPIDDFALQTLHLSGVYSF